ncbi:MAG: ABC transporter permease [Thermoprotei archaeon]|mgnify:CR=1 FL=1|nr:MAG: ABC transporter permease [Thermoprotei archaeon]
MSLARFIARKFFESALTVFIGVTVAFFLFRLLPGDPTAAFLDIRLTPEAKMRLIEEFGLNKPLWEQYFIFIANLLRGNLGLSFVYSGMPVSKLIFGPKLFNTVVLMGLGMVISATIATFLGLLMGWRRGSRFDRVATSVSYAATSAPIFWIGLLILLVFAGYLRVIPASGTVSVELIEADPFTRFVDYLWHLAGPLTVIVIYFLPSYLLYVRNTIVGILGEDFITVLKAKGLRDRTIMFGHLLRYALLTVVTLLALQSPLLVSGAIITETVFGWNGIGLLLYNSVLKSDYPVIQGIFILTIVVVVIANLLADIAAAFIDPRIRLEGGRR